MPFGIRFLILVSCFALGQALLRQASSAVASVRIGACSTTPHPLLHSHKMCTLGRAPFRFHLAASPSPEPSTKKPRHTLWDALRSKVKASVLSVGLFAFSAMLPLSAHATGRASRGQAPPLTSTVVSTTAKATNTGSTKGKKVAVEVDIYEDDEDTSRSQQQLLTKVGLGVGGATVLVALLFGGNSPPPRRSAKKAIRKTSLSSIDIDDLESTDVPLGSSGGRIGNRPRLSEKFKSSTDSINSASSRNVLPAGNPDELFNQDKDADGSMEEAEPPMQSKLASFSRGKSTSRRLSEVAESDEAETPMPQELPAAPAPAQQKKGFLSRFFGRAENGRPVDLVAAIGDPASPSYASRKLIAAILASFVPGEFPEVEGGLGLEEDIVNSTDFEKRVEGFVAAVRQETEAAGLEPQETAGAFADVTNALLTALVDRAAEALDNRDDKEQEGALNGLDTIASFIRGGSEVFAKSVDQSAVKIDPVVYSGKTKKGKLEQLYYRYVKASMDISALLGGLASPPASEGGEEGNDAQISEVEAETAAKAQLQQLRTESLPLVQYVLTIKESKWNSIEQRVMREMVMNVASGKTDLGGLMEALAGQGGMGGLPGMGGSPEDAAALAEMMKSMGGGGGGVPGLEGFDPKQLEGMDPAELQQLSSSSMESITEALREGSITRSDVQELEKIMGVDVKQFVKMFDAGKVDKRKMQELGPQVTDMIDVFRKLAEIK